MTGDVAESRYPAKLVGIQYAAHDINLYQFERADGLPLPNAEPGAHVDLILPNAMIRQYSLVTAGTAPKTYTVGVKLDPNSRGGSRYIHESMRVGQTYELSAPRNNFPLVQDAGDTTFVAGGIGITPIWCMIQRLIELGKTWKLHYACRTRREAAFLDELTGFNQAHLHFDDENDNRLMDMNAIIPEATPATHLYCCGPKPMLAAFEAATQELAPSQVHVEYFTAKLPPARSGGFTVELKRSGKSFFIPAGKTILDVLAAAGFRLRSSCEQGVCGACETQLVSGLPDHRDSVLTPTEKAENKSVMICCAGSLSDRLVLDL